MSWKIKGHYYLLLIIIFVQNTGIWKSSAFNADLCYPRVQNSVPNVAYKKYPTRKDIASRAQTNNWSK